MRSLIVLLFVGSVIADGNNYGAANYCFDICGVCGGQGELTEDTCVCRIDKNYENDECLEQAKNRAESFNLDWRVEESFRFRRFTDLMDDPSFKHAQQDRRILPSDLSFYGPPIFGQAGLRNYRSGYPSNSAVYEILIGDDQKESVQLVFPHSENLEVQHQYLFEDYRGKKHPCSHVISDMDIDFETSNGGNTHEIYPSGLGNPSRDKLYDYSAEERNYPLYNGRNQDNLSTTRVEITDEPYNSYPRFDQRSRNDYSNENYEYDSLDDHDMSQNY